MTITGELVTLFLAVMGALAGVWWRVESKITAAREDAIKVANVAIAAASEASKDLAAHKIYAAETFSTKAGLTEALNRVHDALDKLADRIDLLIDQGRVPRVPRT